RGAPRRWPPPLSERWPRAPADGATRTNDEGPTIWSALRLFCAAQLLGRLPWLAAPLLRALRLRPRLLIGVSRSRSVRTHPRAGFIAPIVPHPGPCPRRGRPRRRWGGSVPRDPEPLVPPVVQDEP